MDLELLQRLRRGCERRVEALTGGGAWRVKSVLVALVVGLFLSFPGYDDIISGRYDFYWEAVLKKYQDPLWDATEEYGGDSHDSKLTYRLVVPIVAWALGLGVWGTIAMNFAVGVLILAAGLELAWRAFGDRASAFYATVLLATIYPGISSFVDLRGGYYDGVTIALLLAGLLARPPLLVGAAVFLASWTDERGLIASPLVLIYHLADRRGASGLVRGLASPAALSVFGAWLLYLGTRLGIGSALGWETNTGGINLGTLLVGGELLPLGLWTAFEGAWLPIVAAFVALVRGRSYLFAAAFLGALAVPVLAAAIVYDVTRSAAIAVPAVFVAFRILGATAAPGEARGLLLLSAMVSVLFPNYDIIRREAHLLYPLPLWALKALALDVLGVRGP